MSSLAEIELLGLEEPEYVAPDEYQAPPVSSGSGALQPGFRTQVKVLAPKNGDANDGADYGKTRNGHVSAQITLQVVEGANKNRLIFHRSFTSPYRQGDRAGQNSFMEFLRGAGYTGELRSIVDYNEALIGLINSETVFSVNHDLEWYDKNTSETFKYAGQFSTKDPDTGRWATSIPSPSEQYGEEDERPTLKGRTIVTGVAPIAS